MRQRGQRVEGSEMRTGRGRELVMRRGRRKQHYNSTLQKELAMAKHISCMLNSLPNILAIIVIIIIIIIIIMIIIITIIIIIIIIMIIIIIIIIHFTFVI